MNLYDHAQNEALGNELVELTDKWPHCDQVRAVELQLAFDDFSEQGGWQHHSMEKWERPFFQTMYDIKRDPLRAQQFSGAQQAIMVEAAHKRATRLLD